MVDTLTEAPVADVVAFPDRASRSWRWFREVMRDHYISLGVAPDVLGPTLDAVGEVYCSRRDCIVPKSTDPDQAIAAINAWVSELAFGLLVEIADREIELRRAGVR